MVSTMLRRRLGTVPQRNRSVERCVQTIKALMKKATYFKGEFNMALSTYRSGPHETTGVSAAQLLMGRRLRTSLRTPPALLHPI